VRSTTRIPGCTAEDVWELIRPAEAALVLVEGCVKAYTEPGTGPGVGEVQHFVLERDGDETTTRIRITELEPPFRVVYEILGLNIPGWGCFEMRERRSGVTVTYSESFELPLGHELIHAAEVQARVDYLTTRIRNVLETRS
jgi:hypothetical protein